jgi:hypothetical protein
VRTSYARGSRTGIQEITVNRVTLVNPVGQPLITARTSATATRNIVFCDVDNRLNVGTGAGTGTLRLLAGLLEFYGLSGNVFQPVTPGRHALGASSNPWGELWVGMKDWGDRVGGIFAVPYPADSANTLRDSPPITLRGRYWDSAAGVSRDRDAQIIHRMLSTTPTSEVVLRIAGADKLGVGDTYIDAKGQLLRNARLSAVSKGLAAVLVTETTATLKQSVAPDPGFYGFAYVEGVRVTASNPAGSGVTLYLQVRALLDDGGEVSLSDWVSVAPGAGFDDWLRWVYDAVGNGRTIREVRLYAYCSATPAAGYEPSVSIAKVTGVQV